MARFRRRSAVTESLLSAYTRRSVDTMARLQSAKSSTKMVDSCRVHDRQTTKKQRALLSPLSYNSLLLSLIPLLCQSRCYLPRGNFIPWIRSDCFIPEFHPPWRKSSFQNGNEVNDAPSPASTALEPIMLPVIVTLSLAELPRENHSRELRRSIAPIHPRMSRIRN